MDAASFTARHARSRRVKGLALLALAMLLSPSALAGTEQDPEIDDGRDAVTPSGNLLSAWFTAEAEGLRFTIKIESVRSPQRDMFYLVAFTHDGTRTIAGVGWDDDTRFRSYVGGPEAGRGGFGLETFANGVMEGDFRLGTPAYFTGVIPYGSVDGLEPGATLTSLHAGVTRLDRSQRTWVDVDPRSTTRTFTIEREPSMLPALSADVAAAAWTVGGAVVGGALGAAAAFGARRVFADRA